jgi:hypothetical protein
MEALAGMNRFFTKPRAPANPVAASFRTEPLDGKSRARTQRAMGNSSKDGGTAPAECAASPASPRETSHASNLSDG